jgi:hypothetical protein
MKTNTAVRSKTGFETGIKVERVRRDGALQLRLLPGGTAQPDWVLDERTRTVGKQGVARAREILARVAPPDAVRRAS